MVAYIISIVNRTSLSAVGVDEADRFHGDAAALSLFAVLQLLVDGALQSPAGPLLDTFGHLGYLTAGFTLMAVGQLVMALTPDVEVSIPARVIVGAGDAAMLLIGPRLDAEGPWTPETHTLSAFKIAFLVQYPLWAIGVVGILRERRWTRAQLVADGVIVPLLHDVIARQRSQLHRPPTK